MNKKLIIVIIGFVMASNWLTACGEQKLKNNVVYEVKEKTNDEHIIGINEDDITEEKESTEDKESTEEKESTEDIDNAESTIDEFSQAVLSNDMEYVKKIIISDSIDINEKDSNGQYPIEVALMFENCQMAKILLEAGADPYVKTSEGKSVYDTVMSEHSKYMKSIFKEYSKDKE